MATCFFLLFLKDRIVSAYYDSACNFRTDVVYFLRSMEQFIIIYDASFLFHFPSIRDIKWLLYRPLISDGECFY